MITEIPLSPSLLSACEFDAMDGETVHFESAVTLEDGVLNPAAGARERILANFRVLARTNAVLRAAVEGESESN